MDFLIIHVPKFQNFYNPMGYFVLGNLPAMGLFSLADYTESEGFSTKILHLGVEALSDPTFRLGDFVRKQSPRAIGFSLHWHYQIPNVLEQIAIVKKAQPGTPVVVGGLTASLLANDLLEKHTEIDFVIRGEGEVPSSTLLKCLAEEGDLSKVPNLSWRSPDGQIQHNPIGFVADRRLLDELSFDRFDLMEHADRFFAEFNHILWLRSFPWMNRVLFKPGTMDGYMVPVGRGCPVDCSYCSGSKSTTESFTGRKSVTLRSINAVVEELKSVRSRGIDLLYFGYDPYPDSLYYPKLFSRIADEGLGFRAIFESFRLPGAKFLDAFEKAFGAGADNLLLISPETGDEALRFSNRGYPYTNEELLLCLDELQRRGLRFHMSYCLGLPGETKATLSQTIKLWKNIRERYPNCAGQAATLIHLDPGSPAASNPAACGIKRPPISLEELEVLHADSSLRSYTGWGHLPLGHECPGLGSNLAGEMPLGETGKMLQQIKCRHFCNYFERLHLGYPLNRMACIAAGSMFRVLGRATGLGRKAIAP